MNSGREMYSELSEFGSTLVETLSSHMTSEGRLINPGKEKPIPDDHYGNTCFAVAGFRAAARSESDRYHRTAYQSLRYFLDLDPSERGHGEFNALAILELIRDARNGRYDLPVSESRLRDEIEFESTIDGQQGNNWLLLRGLCHLRMANLFGRRRDRLAYRRIRRVIKYWIQEDGVVADAPRFPIAPVETPLTYHAKLAALCAHLGVEADDQWFKDAAIDAFRALATITLPTGEALYYGRSENTLFGYATALDGVTRLHIDEPWMAAFRHRLASYLLKTFNPRQAHCQPGGRCARSVDDYVFDGVYSAYAAMVLLGLREASTLALDDPEPIRVEKLETAGLTTVVGHESALAFASKGQIAFTGGIPDPRYSGLTPLSYTVHGKQICLGVPREFLADATPPYLPVAINGTSRYIPVVWSSQRERSGPNLTVSGDGSFYPVKRQSSSEAESSTNGRPPIPERIIRLIGRKAKIPLYLERQRKQPAEIPVVVRRAIHFLADQGLLVIQTGTAVRGEWAIIPTSCVVAPEFEIATTIEFADPTMSTRNETVHTHQGLGTLIRPERSVAAERHWSTIVIDPNGTAEDVTTVRRGDKLCTTVDVADNSSRLELQLPTSLPSQTE